MSTALAEGPRVLHAVPGRLRVHLPGWLNGGSEQIEDRLHQVPGVRRAQANPLTGNILIQFDPQGTDERTLLEALGGSQPEGPPTRPPFGGSLPRSRPTPDRDAEAARASSPPPVLRNGREALRRARIPVRGLDRDPEVARRAVERLGRYPGVRVQLSPLTGRVLVEYDERQVRLEDLRAELAGLEPPDLPGADRPDDPLAVGPLVQSAVRTVSTALGFGWLALRRLTGAAGQAGSPLAATAAGVVNILQAYPLIRDSFRFTLGEDAGDLLLDTSGIVAQALAGSPLGLTLAGAQALRLLTAVRARRTAWRRYEEALEAAPAAYPGANVRRAAGERSPLDARVLEGTGTAVGRDGLPLPLAPGARVPAGARLCGGPFLLELADGPRFVPAERPAPYTSSAYAPYLRADTLLSFAYAAAIAALSGSLRRTFQALLLVSPRTAVIGAEGANQNAAARVLRAGVLIVGTRKDRPVRLPGALLIDGPRVLTDGLEVAGVFPLAEGYESSEALALAGGVSDAAGSPWGKVFPQAGNAPATEGTFDGTTAAASIGGAEYALGLAGDQDGVPEAARREHRGDYLLMLQNRSAGRPLATLALRPRIAPGAEELVRVCRNYGVECVMLPGADPRAGQALSRRTGVPLLERDGAVEEVRRRQRDGAVVAFLSDNAHAGAAFALCDLGIGLSSAPTGPFPARADLLAPDLPAVAAVIEAGAGRDRAIRDAIGLAILDDVVGAVWGVRGSPDVANVSVPSDSAAVTALVDAWWRSAGAR